MTKKGNFKATKEQIDYIVNNYNLKRNKLIAQEIGLSTRMVQNYAQRLGLIDKRNKYYIGGQTVHMYCLHFDSSISSFTISLDDFEKVHSFSKWHIKNYKGKQYVICNINTGKKRTTLKLHRFILNVKNEQVFIDHIDGNGLNNCRENLRICSSSENMSNLTKATIKNKSTGSLNVTFDKRINQYRPDIIVRGIKIYFKNFKKLSDAEALVKYVRAKYLPYSQEYISREEIFKNTDTIIKEYADKKVMEKINDNKL